MTPAGNPAPDGPRPVASELANAARDFRLRMAVIDRETETALDMTRDRYGRTVHASAAAAARPTATRRRWRRTPPTSPRTPTLCSMPPAARSTSCHLPATWPGGGPCWTAWPPPPPRSAGPSTGRPPPAPQPSARSARPCGRTSPHGRITASSPATSPTRADQHHKAPLTEEEQQMWTELAQAAQRRGELELTESWYAADGQPITLAHLVEGDDSTLVALRGDPDAPGWQVIGHYAHEYEAGKVLPAPVPPGVLRADVSGFNRPEPAPEISLQELTRDVVEAQHAGDASNALLSATQRGYDAGPMVRLQELLETSSQFASALETVQGRQVAARLSALGRQIEFLTREVEEAAEDLGATVAVLPPHRTPVLRVRPRPAVDTAPPTPPPRASTPARHR